jgi:hypothetical protein
MPAAAAAAMTVNPPQAPAGAAMDGPRLRTYDIFARVSLPEVMAWQ